MRSTAALIVAVSLTAAACSDSPSGPSGSGTLNLRITDTPFSDARAVLVTFSEVTAHRAESDWTRVPFAAGASGRTCDLKKLETAEDLLGTGPLPAGRYTMVRLVVASATLYFDNPSAGPACAPAISPPAGATAQVEIPSGEVKLNRNFELEAEHTTTMLLDFDGDRSIRETGNGRYMMSPVIAIVSVD
jgi:hypothetical protein